jgi:hypothetical protein
MPFFLDQSTPSNNFKRTLLEIFMKSYGHLFNLAGYPAIFSIRLDIRQVESGIWPDTRVSKKAGLSREELLNQSIGIFGKGNPGSGQWRGI